MIDFNEILNILLKEFDELDPEKTGKLANPDDWNAWGVIGSLQIEDDRFEKPSVEEEVINLLNVNVRSKADVSAIAEQIDELVNPEEKDAERDMPQVDHGESFYGGGSTMEQIKKQLSKIIAEEVRREAHSRKPIDEGPYDNEPDGDPYENEPSNPQYAPTLGKGDPNQEIDAWDPDVKKHYEAKATSIFREEAKEKMKNENPLLYADWSRPNATRTAVGDEHKEERRLPIPRNSNGNIKGLAILMIDLKKQDDAKRAGDAEKARLLNRSISEKISDWWTKWKGDIEKKMNTPRTGMQDMGGFVGFEENLAKIVKEEISETMKVKKVKIKKNQLASIIKEEITRELSKERDTRE